MQEATNPSSLSQVDLAKLIAHIEGKPEVLSYTPGKATPISTQKRLLELLKAYEDQQQYMGGEQWFQEDGMFPISSCPKHQAFFDATADYREVLFCMGNRSGKTVSGALAVSYHLTGIYPPWWKGRRFTKPVSAWACGKTSETTRDIVQKELVGEIGRFGTGTIAKKYILETRARPGVPNGLSTVTVRHISGGVSTLGFKSYDQGVESMVGTAKDVIWCDEEPPAIVYAEMVIRTMTTNGILMITATPDSGMTQFMKSFEKTADFLGGSVPCISRDHLPADHKASRAVIRGGWAHAPWLTDLQKKEILASIPPHLHKAKEWGIPSQDEANVYQIEWDAVACEPREIPKFWKRWYGMDVGWNNTAVCWFAEDPNTSTIYMYDAYKAGKIQPLNHADAINLRGKWIPGVVDPASRGRSQVDGQQLLKVYRDLGLKLMPADNSVESGIYTIWELLSNKKLQIFNTLREVQSEYMTYARDADGKIKKVDDHLMDAMRYGILSGRKLGQQFPVARGAVDGTTRSRYDI